MSGETFGEVKRVADMHERKSTMFEHADAFIALPGMLNKGMKLQCEVWDLKDNKS